jgi:hypothetical protein
MLLLALAAAALAAADVTGKWKAEMPGPGGATREVTFTFKVEGDKLTGTMSTPRGEREISEGKVSGDEISFVMVMPGREGGQVKVVYTGKVAGDEIKFTSRREGAERSFEFTAKRAQ